MTERRQFLWMAASAAVLQAALAQGVGKETTLVFPYYFQTSAFNLYRRILEIAYAAMGCKVVIEKMPTERGLMESRRGKLAGKITRAPIIEKTFPDLMRVPVLLDMVGASTFVKAHFGPAIGRESAALLRVGIVRGVKLVEAWTTDWLHVERLDNSTELIKMLDAGNVDVIIAFTDDVRNAMAENAMSATVFNAKEVERIPQYHYLHKHHAALVPGITVELNKIRGNFKTVAEGFKSRGDK